MPCKHWIPSLFLIRAFCYQAIESLDPKARDLCHRASPLHKIFPTPSSPLCYNMRSDYGTAFFIFYIHNIYHYFSAYFKDIGTKQLNRRI